MSFLSVFFHNQFVFIFILIYSSNVIIIIHVECLFYRTLGFFVTRDPVECCMILFFRLLLLFINMLKRTSIIGDDGFTPVVKRIA